MLTDKRKHAAKGMDILRASVPASTARYFREVAAREGIPIQAVLAPVLNAYARGEIRQEFTQPGAPRE